MSRLVKKPITCPKGVEAKFDGKKVSVKGPKGTVHIEISEGVDVVIDGAEVTIKSKPTLEHKALLGMCRSHINNAVIGVTQGFEKKLELVGVGYKATLKGNVLDLSLGFSHPSVVKIPEGVKVGVDKNVSILVTGVDKHAVGQFAASVRALKPPEPYKGKGVRYQNEVVRKKAGKKSK